jgi:hypothetical protein
VVREATIRFDLGLRESLGTGLRAQALVVQEDRHLRISGFDADQLDGSDELNAACSAVAAQCPLPLGRYLLCRESDSVPELTYRAVVHDLEASPTCRPGNVRRSLVAIVEDAVKRGVTNIVCDPLGSWQDNGLSLEELVGAFDEAIVELSVVLQLPFRLTLLLGELGQVEEVSHMLRSRVLRRASRSFRTVAGDAAVVEVRQRGARLHFRFVPGSLSGYMVTRVNHTA